MWCNCHQHSSFHAFNVGNEFVSGWSRGRAARLILWGWTTFCRSWDSTMQGLQFPSGCRGEWWTLWIKFCPFSLRNLAWHCRMRKRRKVKETKTSINSKHFNVLIDFRYLEPSVWISLFYFIFLTLSETTGFIANYCTAHTRTHYSHCYTVWTFMFALVHIAIALGWLKVFFFLFFTF